jgi:hypothetical protein
MSQLGRAAARGQLARIYAERSRAVIAYGHGHGHAYDQEADLASIGALGENVHACEIRPTR